MSKLIAIIDDDLAIRGGVSSLLRSAGFEVQLYASAEAFLQETAAPKPDVVLTDVQMLGMSGLDLQSILKTRAPTLPLMFMTAFPEDALRKRALDAGAICFLSKPFKATELLYWIEKALSA
jgi:FixJ family two-component response regulator